MDPTRRLRELGVRSGRFQSKFVWRHELKSRHPRPVRRRGVWESLFMRKSRQEKQEIIRRPWELPMAAQQLSAIAIQRRVRGMLCRMRLRASRPSAASSQQRRQSSRRLSQSPMQRFIRSGRGSFEDDLGFRHFAATLIQAWYRKEQLRWRYGLARFSVYHIAALQIQYAWRGAREQRRRPPATRRAAGRPLTRTQAALVLQGAWRMYTHRRIYRYYRDLITFRAAGDPALMLRAINPTEAGLLDAAMGAHVRFRLGGVSFPPTIYYKIFTRKAVCDLGAFSPKDYAQDRQAKPHAAKSKKDPRRTAATTAAGQLYIRVGQSYHRAITTATTASSTAAEDMRRWYQRIENNGWRPVTAKVLAEASHDPIAVATGSKVAPTRLVRRQDLDKLRRLKKRQWMQKLYAQGLVKRGDPGGERRRRLGTEEEDEQEEEEEAEDVGDVDFADGQWEDEAEAMFQWAAGLDFDEYVEDWRDLGRTASTDD